MSLAIPQVLTFILVVTLNQTSQLIISHVGWSYQYPECFKKQPRIRKIGGFGKTPRKGRDTGGRHGDESDDGDDDSFGIYLWRNPGNMDNSIDWRSGAHGELGHARIQVAALSLLLGVWPRSGPRATSPRLEP